MSFSTCQRCRKPNKSAGPWRGAGGFTLLCGGCKVAVCLEQPGFKERLEAELNAGLQDLADGQTTIHFVDMDSDTLH